MAEQYMQALIKSDYQQAVTFYSKKEQERALHELMQTSDSLGSLRDVKLEKKEINTVFSGKFFLYEYATVYERYSNVNADYSRHHATDVLTVFYNLSDKTLRIVSHMVESDGLH